MENDIIKRLAAELNARISTPVPVSASFWGKAEICACLGCGKTTVDSLISRADFPPSYRFPTKGQGSHPKWKAKDVLAWAENYRVVKAVA